MVTIPINITSVGFHHCGAFIPALGPGGPQWGPVKLIMSICLSVPPSVHPRRFFGNHFHGL